MEWVDDDDNDEETDGVPMMMSRYHLSFGVGGCGVAKSWAGVENVKRGVSHGTGEGDDGGADVAATQVARCVCQWFL